MFFSLITLVTVIYLLIGFYRTTMFDTVFSQVVTVYIIFPIIWVIVFNFILDTYPIETIVKKYIGLSLIGCGTVYLAYLAIAFGYIDYVKIFVERPNAVFTGNVFAITLHVFGTLIFISAAIGNVQKLYKKTSVYLLIMLFFFITAAVSGRSALILSMLVGIFLFISGNGTTKFVKNALLLFAVGVVLLIVLLYYGVDLGGSFQLFFNELKAGGGGERQLQTKKLFEGIIDSYLLGAGHGVGIDYIRNYEFPWRYENLIFATIYRVGIVGFVVYFIPYIYSTTVFIQLKRLKIINMFDKFFFWGNTMFVFMNFTNPYLESFEFQIPYYFTFCYFYYRAKSKIKHRDENSTIDEIRS